MYTIKGVRDFWEKTFFISLRESSPDTKAVVKPTNIVGRERADREPSKRLTTVEPMMIGTESRKQNEALLLGESPTALPAKKVVPLRLRPGKRAKPCEKPMITAWKSVGISLLFLRLISFDNRSSNAVSAKNSGKKW